MKQPLFSFMQGQKIIDHLLSSLNGPEAVNNLGNAFKEFESNLNTFDTFISLSASSKSPFHQILANDQLQTICLESYFHIISILLANR